MKAGRKLDHVLSECIDLLAAGASVEECIRRYPEQRSELEPMLEVVLATMRLGDSVVCSPEAKARGLARLMAAVSQAQTLPARRPGVFQRVPLLRPVAIGLAVIVLMGGATTGATLAASDSMPGEPLYWVKTTSENISLRLPKSDMALARLHAELAGVRSEEMQKLMFRGRNLEAERMLVRIDHHLKSSADLLGVVAPANEIDMPLRPAKIGNGQDMARLLALLETDVALLHNRLRQLVENAAPPQKPLMQKIRWDSEVRYRVLIAALEGGEFPAERHMSLTEFRRFLDQ